MLYLLQQPRLCEVHPSIRIVKSLQNNEYITSCTPLSDASGYTIAFSSGKSIVIKNGTDGKNGITPQLGIDKFNDGLYYWTLDGKWLLDAEGRMVMAEGPRGADGITPKLKIENGDWLLSIDSGESWTCLGRATGDDGKDGDSLFKSVTQCADYILFILSDNTELRVPYHNSTGSNSAVTGEYSFITSNEAIVFGWCNQKEEDELSAVYGIEYSSTDLTTDAKTVIAASKDSENKFSCNLEGLSLRTRYYYRAFCYFNKVYSFGEVKTFTTPSIDASVSVESSNVRYHYATISGLLAVEAEGEFSKSAVVYYSCTESSLEALKSGGAKQKMSIGSDGSFSTELHPLLPDKKYHYCVVVTLNGAEFASEVKNLTTPELPAGSVGLGLSVAWGSCNIGASEPEGYGERFAWGETSTKGSYWPESYIHYKGNKSSSGYELESILKYNLNEASGIVDNKTILDSEDDVAHAKLGKKWRMPTDSELDELMKNCSFEWTAVNGIYGYKVTSKIPGFTDSWIFLPAAGMHSSTVSSTGVKGYYWTSSLAPYKEYGKTISLKSSVLVFTDYSVSHSSHPRYYGFSVRPVTD